VVGQQNADTADALHRRELPWQSLFGFLYMGCTLAPPGEYNWTVQVQWRCGLMPNYFDNLLLLGSIAAACGLLLQTE